MYSKMASKRKRYHASPSSESVVADTPGPSAPPPPPPAPVSSSSSSSSSAASSAASSSSKASAKPVDEPADVPSKSMRPVGRRAQYMFALHGPSGITGTWSIQDDDTLAKMDDDFFLSLLVGGYLPHLAATLTPDAKEGNSPPSCPTCSKRPSSMFCRNRRILEPRSRVRATPSWRPAHRPGSWSLSGRGS